MPELEIDEKNVHRNMHKDYVDIPYSYDADFEDESKIHVLVLGDSFGRDFVNILRESKYKECLEISYIYDYQSCKAWDRIPEADFVFFASNGWKVPETIKNVPKEKLYIVGNKSFGNSNGIIYMHRGDSDYFEQKVDVSEDMLLHNNAMKGVFSDHYIDMITPLLDDNNKIRVFTDDNFFISQDCRHLTKQGARYYARLLDLSFIVK